MSIKLRNYKYPEDYRRVDDFLIQLYRPGNMDGNWIEPIWEYMHGHPYLDQSSLGKIGIWEDDGMLVAVANYESRLGEAFFQIHPDYGYLKRDMLDYVEKNLYATSENNAKLLHVFMNDTDEDGTTLIKESGYEMDADNRRPMYRFDIPDPFPAIHLPEGFQLKSLADECNWAKVHRVIWRGFNHPGEPPSGDDELESRRKMFDTPKARRDLKIAVEVPGGDFVAFCGMFYEPICKFAYVEPVATDPNYRRMGLGKAAVLEGIRRCGELGATVAYVGSDQDFYKAIGFTKVYNSECWTKNLT